MSEVFDVGAPARWDGDGRLSRQVVAFGGGHGLAASLSALRRVVDDLCAVVTVADNGGSSGRLRGEYDVLPPGDLRMALAALCGDDEWGSTWARLMQHRFPGDGPMGGHAVGNLLMVGLWDLMGDRVHGLEWVARLLGVEGRVLPMSLEPLDITARVRGEDPLEPDSITTVRGQEEVALAHGEVLSIALHPESPPACEQAVSAVRDADWLVLGPGSWYSSVIPHLLVPDLRSALVASRAQRMVVLNLTQQSGETDGWSSADHLRALVDYAPDLRLDVVLADPSSLGPGDGLAETAEELGARLLIEDVRRAGDGAAHDPVKLARAFTGVMGRS